MKEEKIQLEKVQFPHVDANEAKLGKMGGPNIQSQQKPADIQPIEKHSSKSRGLFHLLFHQKLDATAGWSMSLLFHGLLFLLFLYVTLSKPVVTGQGGTEVGVFYENPGQAIDAGPEGPASEKFNLPDVNVSPLAETADSTEPFAQQQMDSSLLSSELDLQALPVAEMDSGIKDSLFKKNEAGILAGGGADKAGTASFFGLEARGSRFVYVVDRSGSMRGAKLQAAKNELVRSVNYLGQRMKFCIIFYNDNYEIMPGGQLVRATGENKRKYLYWARQMRSAGGTYPVTALERAISLKPDAIWLLSDGLFKGEDVAGDVQRMNRYANVQIHTIAFYDNVGEKQLRKIAMENRGRYRFVKAPGIRRISR